MNPPSSPSHSPLPRRFLRLSPEERKKILKPRLAALSDSERALFFGSPEEEALSDSLIEGAVGQFQLPLGIAGEFLINQRIRIIPLATEEASVVAACRFAGSLISLHGGFSAEGAEPLMEGQIFLKGCSPGAEEKLAAAGETLKERLQPHWESLEKRGGGWHSFKVETLEEGLLKGEITLNVCDAQGANRVNQLAEAALPLMEEITGGEGVMAICSNSSRQRIARASFCLPLKSLGQGKGGRNIAKKIVLACRIAEMDPGRAITHNKGIMNGVTALALATGNDTRALEAAVHSYACRTGQYRPLSRFTIEGESLLGRIELPMALATRGGITGVHPAAKGSLALLGDPHASDLTAIAAAVGLAQNFAALRALVTEGIQKGHMKLHRRKSSYGENAL